MNYIETGNWNEVVYRRLNLLIHDHRSSKNTLKHDRQYVVFDFDDTTSINNTLVNTTVYMMNQLAYRISPSQFRSILEAVPPEKTEHWIKNRPEVTLENLFHDIVKNYAWLYENYIMNPDKNADMLHRIQNTYQFKDFRAKLWFFYKNRKMLNFKRVKGKPWNVYWFAGYTQKELINFSKKALREMSKKPFKKNLFKGTGRGKAGYIEEYYNSGLSFPEETLDLYKSFQNNGIDVYIVSASPYEIVVGAVEEFNYNVPRNHIFGMSTSRNDDGKINSIIDSQSIMTQYNGKTAAIKENIIPLYMKEPIAVFGDSYGDYYMMTEFDTVQLNVLFNRYYNDKTKTIVNGASNHSTYSKFVIQGRDENTGELRPSSKTIPFGFNKEVLTFDDL